MTDYLITSALPYVSGVKHLGNLAGSLLPADVHARFRRQIGDRVLFLCGTDELGTPAELAASRAGRDVATFCAEQHAIQADIYARFGLSFDHFGRTSSPSNHALTRHFLVQLHRAGHLEERTVPQIWSPDDDRYLPDRYVLGTCPHCSSKTARGDQCDRCDALLDPTDLLDPRSALSGRGGLVTRQERHLFLLQSRLAPRLSAWLETRASWPPFVVALAKGLLADCADRCITRDLAWGVAVPIDGFEHKVAYVWFDAPIGYLAATVDWAAADPSRGEWRQWWDPSEDVRYLQFLGKDNVAFHTVTFPATLIGSGEPWRTVDVVKGFNWLSYEGGKFSTSARRGIFTDEALELLPADLWRWWLVANAPETADTDFRVARFAADVNKDLADIFGNLACRAIGFAHRAFAGTIPTGGTPGPAEGALARALDDRLTALRGFHESLEFRKAAAETRAIWTLANVYLQEQAAWTCVKTDVDRAAITTRTALNVVRIAARIAWPIIPTLSETVSAAFGETGRPEWPNTPTARFLDSAGGRPLGRLDPPVRKLDAATVAAIEARFAGHATEGGGLA